jgi:Uma2 family endonuclease
MNTALRKPRMTREEFFAWAQARDTRYEFDGFEPVAMTGGTANHSQITQNILLALCSRLQGSSCRPLGPDAGVATIGGAVRYPNALVTCATVPGDHSGRGRRVRGAEPNLRENRSHHQAA